MSVLVVTNVRLIKRKLGIFVELTSGHTLPASRYKPVYMIY